jgi:hypothetical protein
MNCTKNDLSPIYVEWPEGWRLYPTEVSFSYSRDSFDYFSCKFPAETANDVADLVKTEVETNRVKTVTEPAPVSVVVNDTPVRRMYYDPELLKLGLANDRYEKGGKLELKDMHTTLASGVVDMAPDKAPTEKVYNEIFTARKEGRSNPNYLTGIDIRKDTTIKAQGNNNTFSFGTTNPFKSNHLLPFSASHAIQFNQATPLEAINKANEQFGLRTHVDENGQLVVGEYKERNSYTSSRSAQNTTFQIKSGKTTPKNSKVEKVVINGPKHYPNLEASNPGAGVKFAESAFDWLNPLDDNENDEETVENGYRLQVVVENTNLSEDPERNGVVRNINAYDVSNEDLARSGERIFMSLETGSGGGNLVFDMDGSSTDTIPRIADTVFVSEEDKCGELEQSAYRAGSYKVSGVEHRFNGQWEVELDVVETTVAEDNLSKSLRVLDLSSGKAYTYEEIYGYSPEKGIDGYND